MQRGCSSREAAAATVDPGPGEGTNHEGDNLCLDIKLLVKQLVVLTNAVETCVDTFASLASQSEYFRDWLTCFFSFSKYVMGLISILISKILKTLKILHPYCVNLVL